MDYATFIWHKICFAKLCKNGCVGKSFFWLINFLAKSLIHEWKISGFCGIIVNFRCHDMFTFLNSNVLRYSIPTLSNNFESAFLSRTTYHCHGLTVLLTLRILVHTSYIRIIHNEPTDEFHSLRLEASTSDFSVLLYHVRVILNRVKFGWLIKSLGHGPRVFSVKLSLFYSNFWCCVGFADIWL